MLSGRITVLRPTVNGYDAGSTPACSANFIARSFNGRTLVSEAGYGGSSPSRATKVCVAESIREADS